MKNILNEIVFFPVRIPVFMVLVRWTVESHLLDLKVTEST